MLISKKTVHPRGTAITGSITADTTRLELIETGSGHGSPKMEEMISEIVSLIFAGGQARLVGSTKGLTIEIPP